MILEHGITRVLEFDSAFLRQACLNSNHAPTLDDQREKTLGHRHKQFSASRLRYGAKESINRGTDTIGECLRSSEMR